MQSKSVKWMIVLFIFQCIVGSTKTVESIPPDMKSIVTFIYIKHNGEYLPNGTGFFVRVVHPSEPTIYQDYLVTSKHLLYPSKANTTIDIIYVRMNTKTGEPKLVPISTTEKEYPRFSHIDSTVDIVVIPCNIPAKDYDFKVLDSDNITTRKEYIDYKISEGTEVFFTGLFTSYTGSKKMHPIVRFGRVALVTDEKINWGGEMMSLYLIEAFAYGGNSGSPVFFIFENNHIIENQIFVERKVKLAGVLQGFFNDDAKVQNTERPKTPYVKLNTGIAAVVPAYLLHEILYGNNVIKNRGF